ncbi:MAG: hypothetical protein U0X91_19905 [Spirosomataceae bacterium]
MKKLIPIGLFIVLLYHTLGLSVAVLFFEEEYRWASPSVENDQWNTIKIPLEQLPYVAYQEIPAEQEGLIQKDGDFYNIVNRYYQNDTLYIVLKTNQQARERFIELSGQILESLDAASKAPSTPAGKTIELLQGMTKIYLSNPDLVWPPLLLSGLLPEPIYSDPRQLLSDPFRKLFSPPPEPSKLL